MGISLGNICCRSSLSWELWIPGTSVFFNFCSQLKKSDENAGGQDRRSFCFVIVKGKGVFRLIYLINVDPDQ